MKKAIAITLFALCCSVANARTKLPRTQVVVYDNELKLTSYDWQVPGRSSVSCYSSGCSGYYMPAQSGTSTVHGARLLLLLPDSSIVVAECLIKPDIARDVIALVEEGIMAYVPSTSSPYIPASTGYRDCRDFPKGSKLEAEFRGGNVKLFIWWTTSKGKVTGYSETYRYLGTLTPSTSPGMAMGAVAPEVGRPIGQTGEASRHLDSLTPTTSSGVAIGGVAPDLSGPMVKTDAPSKPAPPTAISNVVASSPSFGTSAKMGTVRDTADGQAPTQAQLTEMEKAGLASRCLILTIPSDAEIDIDGKKSGKSPLLLTLTRNGDAPRVITVKKEGYVTVEKRISPDGDVIRFSSILEATDH